MRDLERLQNEHQLMCVCVCVLMYLQCCVGCWNRMKCL